MPEKKNELMVITRAKDLCSYIMTITEKSPEHFRYTFVSRLQNLSLSIIENLIIANDVFITKDDLFSQKKRLEYQRSAMTNLKVLEYMSLLSLEVKCILPKQYEQIAKGITESIGLLSAWISSDRKRLR